MRTADGPVPVLDLGGHTLDPGSLVIDAEGCLIGLAAIGPNGEAIVVPGAMISRMMVPTLSFAAPSLVPLAAAASNTRGWLGLALQPITVPNVVVARAGQSSGTAHISEALPEAALLNSLVCESATCCWH